jgi:hypothetical protein
MPSPISRGMRISPGGSSATSITVFIIHSDSDEEEDAVNAEAVPPSAVKSTAPTASVVDVDDADKGTLDDSNGGRSPDRAIGDISNGGDETGSP